MLFKKVKNNDYRVAMLSNCSRNHHVKFEIDRTILTCLKCLKMLTDLLKKLYVTDGKKDGPTLIIEKLRF